MTRMTPTDTLLERGRRAAKRARAEGLEAHAQALDRFAMNSGYGSWRELAQANVERKSRAADQSGDRGLGLLVDPILPKNFDQTPNEERSREQLDEWWNRPFALTNSDGSLTVRCLDGGAWDRSTNYGIAADPLEAAELGFAKLARWRKRRSAPTVMFEGTTVSVVVLPQRPDREAEVLATSLTPEQAGAFIKEWMARGSADDDLPTGERLDDHR